MAYRLVKITYPNGNERYKVMKQRKKFFVFGPLVWVNAGSCGTYYDTTEFIDRKDAERFMASLYALPVESIIKEVVV